MRRFVAIVLAVIAAAIALATVMLHHFEHSSTIHGAMRPALVVVLAVSAIGSSVLTIARETRPLGERRLKLPAVAIALAVLALLASPMTCHFHD